MAYAKVHNKIFLSLIIVFNPSPKLVLGTLADAEGGLGGWAGK